MRVSRCPAHAQRIQPPAGGDAATVPAQLRSAGVGATPQIQCGRGLAPDSGGSVIYASTDTQLLGANPLPHFDRVPDGQRAGSNFSVPRVLAVTSSSLKCACS